MTKISIPFFQGIRPSVSPDNIGNNEAQIAQNCKLWNGNLRPWDNYLIADTLDNIGIVKKIYLYQDEYWLEWEAEVDLIEAPVSGDTEGKIFWTGSGIPKKSKRDMIITGTGAMPRDAYPLSIPTPLLSPTASASSPPAGSGDDRYINYIWTVVSEWGEEGYPSNASSQVTAKNGQLVNLSDMSMIWQSATEVKASNSVYKTTDEGGTYLFKCVQSGTTGSSEPTWNETVNGYTYDGSAVWQCFNNNLSYKRIYRIIIGNETATYQFVTQIAISTTTYADSKEDADLSNSCPTISISRGGAGIADYDPADDDLLGLCYIGNGIAVAFKGKDIYFSIPYKMWAFPIEFSQAVPESIVSITSIGEGAAVICTTKKAYILQGTSPAAITIDPLEHTKPNLSKRGAVPYENGVIYPAADGLRYVGNGANNIITKAHYTVEEWKNLYPSTMHGAIHNNKYYGFYSGDSEGGFVFDLLSNSEPTTLDFYCFSTYVGPNDKLYFIRSTSMSQFKESLLNPDARATSGKATQYDLSGGAGVMAGISQPDYPRNVVLTITDGDTSISAIDITIAGTLADGSAGSENKTLTDLIIGSNDLNVAFSHIDSITINSVTGAGSGDTLDLGYGKKFGLGNSIEVESDILKVNINDDDSPVASQTISTTYGTIQFATDPDGSNDYQVMYQTT